MVASVFHVISHESCFVIVLKVGLFRHGNPKDSTHNVRDVGFSDWLNNNLMLKLYSIPEPSFKAVSIRSWLSNVKSDHLKPHSGFFGASRILTRAWTSHTHAHHNEFSNSEACVRVLSYLCLQDGDLLTAAHLVGKTGTRVDRSIRGLGRRQLSTFDHTFSRFYPLSHQIF